MPDTRTFTEPDEYAFAIGAETQLWRLAPGQFNASITCVNLTSLRIRRFSENRPRIMYMPNNETVVSFHHNQPAATMIYNGKPLPPNSIVYFGQSQALFQRLDGAAIWDCVSLLDGSRAAISSEVGCDLASINMTITAASGIAKFRRIIDLLVSSDIIELVPTLARSFEQTLFAILLECCTSNSRKKNNRVSHRHKIAMQALHSLLEDTGDDIDNPLYVMEMAKYVGVSVRSLTALCNNYLGMGPKSYSTLRRMHLVRRELQRGTSDEMSVTEIATKYGFWQLGRFAVNYKSLFGESPSRTLRSYC